MPQRANVDGCHVKRRKFLREPQTCICGLIGTSRDTLSPDFKDKAWAGMGNSFGFLEAGESVRIASFATLEKGGMEVVLSRALTGTLILKFAVGPIAP